MELVHSLPVPHPHLMGIPEIVLAASLVVVFIVTNWMKSHKKISDQTFRKIATWTQVVGGTLFSILSWEASRNGLINMEHAFERATHYLGLGFTQLLIAVVIIGLGIGAYRFKRRNKKWYGIVEVIIGVLSAVVVARSLAPNGLDLAKWSTLAGCSYVIARGLGNRKEAAKDAEKALSASPSL